MSWIKERGCNGQEFWLYVDDRGNVMQQPGSRKAIKQAGKGKG